MLRCPWKALVAKFWWWQRLQNRCWQRDISHSWSAGPEGVIRLNPSADVTKSGRIPWQIREIISLGTAEINMTFPFPHDYVIFQSPPDIPTLSPFPPLCTFAVVSPGGPNSCITRNAPTPDPNIARLLWTSHAEEAVTLVIALGSRPAKQGTKKTPKSSPGPHF